MGNSAGSNVNKTLEEGTPGQQIRVTVPGSSDNKSSDQMNLLKSMKEFDSEKGNISYYENTYALKKNSVIDRLLIDRTLAEKNEEYAAKTRALSPKAAVASSLDHSGKPEFDGSVVKTAEEYTDSIDESDELEVTVIAGVQGNLSVAGKRNKANTTTRLDETRLDNTMIHD